MDLTPGDEEASFSSAAGAGAGAGAGSGAVWAGSVLTGVAASCGSAEEWRHGNQDITL